MTNTTTDTPTSPHTLASIASDAKVTKRTAQRWLSKCGDIGTLDDATGARYFTDAERDQLLNHRAPTKQAQQTKLTADTSADTAPTVPTQIEVCSGNHRSLLNAPELPQSVSLAKFRTQDSSAIDLSTVTQAIQGVRAIRQGLSADLEQQWAQLEATQQAAELVEAELNQLERDADKYAVTSDILARLQTQSAKGVQRSLGKLSALGSPSQPPSSQGDA